MSLETPKTVQKLQTVLHAKAKSEPNYKFYSLWDKIYRWDIMWEAWKRVKANRGAPGMDNETFEMIQDQGVNKWLGKLRKELMEKSFRSVLGLFMDWTRERQAFWWLSRRREPWAPFQKPLQLVQSRRPTLLSRSEILENELPLTNPLEDIPFIDNE